jgi:hypothetical protein
MRRRVCVVRTDVSEEIIASIFRVENSTSEEQRQQLAGILRHISEDNILHSRLRENLKSYIGSRVER